MAGCGTINEKLSAGMGDYIPQWAGGLPADAPPRPGTAKYDAFMQERERQRLMPAAERDDRGSSRISPSSTRAAGSSRQRCSEIAAVHLELRAALSLTLNP